MPGADGLPPEASSRAIDEYLAVLDDAAFGAATPVVPKFTSPSDPASRWTGADKGPAYFAYATNYLIDLDHAVIVDVEATTAVRQAEVGAVQTMIERVRERHDLQPARLAADTAYGSAEMLDWLVNKQQIAPHIPVIDKSGRGDGTFARSDFIYDPAADIYRCPTGKTPKRNRRAFRTPRSNAPPDDTYVLRRRRSHRGWTTFLATPLFGSATPPNRSAVHYCDPLQLALRAAGRQASPWTAMRPNAAIAAGAGLDAQKRTL